MVKRLLIAPLLALAACSQRPVAEDRGGGIDAPHRRIPWQRVATLPHATDSFTQGLVFVGPRLYESVGLVGHSRLLELDPATGATLRSQPWPARVGSDERPFAEGLAHADGRLIQLSWHSEVALTWSEDFVRGPDLRYEGEGWGLCFDGTHLWRSDGTSTLHRHRPTDFGEAGTLAVTVGGEPVPELNELECIDGAIYANVWQTPYVVRIDAATGHVTGTLDLQPLIDDASSGKPVDVLNGTAWDPAGRQLFVTGKLWPTMYRITVDGLDGR
jgi:glutamine cyclotransferase